jgi:hypothetical protein
VSNASITVAEFEQDQHDQLKAEKKFLAGILRTHARSTYRGTKFTRS